MYRENGIIFVAIFALVGYAPHLPYSNSEMTIPWTIKVRQQLQTFIRILAGFSLTLGGVDRLLFSVQHYTGREALLLKFVILFVCLLVNLSYPRMITPIKFIDWHPIYREKNGYFGRSMNSPVLGRKY